MKAYILSFTENGTKTGRNLKIFLEGMGHCIQCYAAGRFFNEAEGIMPVEPDLKSVVKTAFERCDALIFIGACGIAVRAIAPFIKNKTIDPGVICIDEKGRFVIPLLSGHIGGANRLAENIAGYLKACPVITTATDINGLFSADEWAAQNGMHIEDMKAAKKISALLLEGKEVGFYSDFEITGDLPFRICRKTDLRAGISISLDQNMKPFELTLNLIPKAVYLGIGCKKGTESRIIEKFVIELLEKKKVSIHAIKGIATIDIKKEECGLISFAQKYNLPLCFFSGDELLKAPGKYTGSDFVKSVTGVDNVCERAAVLASGNGRLISRKVSQNGLTAALALENWRVCFEC